MSYTETCSWHTRTCWHTPVLLQVLSGSSDGTLKLWSVGQQCCIQTYKIHEEGVWSLLVNDSFTQAYSAGRDRRVWLTDLRQSSAHTLICEERSPVLKVRLKFSNHCIFPFSLSELNEKSFCTSVIKALFASRWSFSLTRRRCGWQLLTRPSTTGYAGLSSSRAHCSAGGHVCMLLYFGCELV